jgi:hypothetical protein
MNDEKLKQEVWISTVRLILQDFENKINNDTSNRYWGGLRIEDVDTYLNELQGEE